MAEARKVKSDTRLSWSCTGCQALGSTVTELKACIVALQDEIALLKTAAARAVPRVDAGSLPPDVMESVIYEIGERTKRQSNLMVFGLTESGDDRAALAEVMNVLEVDTDFSAVTIRRLGKLDVTRQNTSRPLRVTFPNPAVVHSAIRSSRRLFSSTRWKGVRVSSDKTPLQSLNYRRAKDELTARAAAGETNLRIMHRNGFPVVVARSDNPPGASSGDNASEN